MEDLNGIRLRCMNARAFSFTLAADLVSLCREALFKPDDVLAVAEEISSGFPSTSPYRGVVQYALALMGANAARIKDDNEKALGLYDKAESILVNDEYLKRKGEVQIVQRKAILEGKAEVYRVDWKFDKAKECYEASIKLSGVGMAKVNGILSRCNLAGINIDLFEHGRDEGKNGAEKLIMEAESILESQTNVLSEKDIDENRGSIAGTKGRYFAALGEFTLAAKCYHEAYDYFMRAKNSWRASRALRFESMALSECGDYENSQELFQKAAEVQGDHSMPYDEFRMKIAGAYNLVSAGTLFSDLAQSSAFGRYLRDSEVEKFKCLLGLSSSLVRSWKMAEAHRQAKLALQCALQMGVGQWETAARIQLAEIYRIMGKQDEAYDQSAKSLSEINKLPHGSAEITTDVLRECVFHGLDTSNRMVDASNGKDPVRKTATIYGTAKYTRSLSKYNEALASRYAQNKAPLAFLEAAEASSSRLPIGARRTRMGEWNTDKLRSTSLKLREAGYPSTTVFYLLDVGTKLVIGSVNLFDCGINILEQPLCWDDKCRTLLSHGKTDEREYHKSIFTHTLNIIAAAQSLPILSEALRTVNGTGAELIHVVTGGVWNSFPFEYFFERPVSRIGSMAMFDRLIDRATAVQSTGSVPRATAVCMNEDLPFAGFEYSVIAGKFGGKNVWPEDRNCALHLDMVLKEMSMSAIVHVASHFEFSRHSRKSGIRLDATKPPSYLTTYQVANDLQFEHPAFVMLNNCESGMIFDDNARKCGMPFAFLEAGAVSCVACIRKPADILSAIVCEFFYEHLNAEPDLVPAGAIYKAIRDLGNMSGDDIVRWTDKQTQNTNRASRAPIQKESQELARLWNRENCRDTLRGWLGYQCFGLGFVPIRHFTSPPIRKCEECSRA